MHRRRFRVCRLHLYRVDNRSEASCSSRSRTVAVANHECETVYRTYCHQNGLLTNMNYAQRSDKPRLRCVSCAQEEVRSTAANMRAVPQDEDALRRIEAETFPLHGPDQTGIPCPQAI
jgi:hypothetical protein